MGPSARLGPPEESHYGHHSAIGVRFRLQIELGEDGSDMCLDGPHTEHQALSEFGL
jgi:hypothetical protein